MRPGLPTVALSWGAWVSGGQSRVPGWTGAQPHRLLHACLRLHNDTLYMMPLPLEAPRLRDSGLTPTPRSCLWLPGRSRPVLRPLPWGCLPLPEASDRMEDMANKPVPAGSRAGAGSQVGGALLPAGAPHVAWLHRETPRGPWAAPAAKQSPQKRRQEAVCDSVPAALLPSFLEPLDQAGGRWWLGPQTGWLLPH